MMRFTKISMLAAGTLAVFLFSGCVSSESSVAPGIEDFVYRGHDFGPDRDSDYRRGVMDGCRTTDGDYTKDHGRFKTNESYRAGWEHGRLHCKGTSVQ
ncbi:hypothetical protein [Sulfurovum sp.]|uniref:hypothetical protein n=1 Tax=Sulfurovum sp. TaxID=1969726 RepID=UPI0025F6D6F9|nr:hypothetical protein [Sulfurovum sp.]